MRFLVVKLSSIGDIVHTLPAVAALRKAYPNSSIDWVVERSASAILDANPTVNEIIKVDTRKWRKGLLKRKVWQDIVSAVTKLKSKNYDLVFDFQGLLKSGLIVALSGAKKRLGFSNDGLREEASRFFLTHQIVIDKKAHIIEKNLQLVKALGVVADRYDFPIAVSQADESYIDKQLELYNLQHFVIINPGGGWTTKLWPLARYAELADRIFERFKLRSLVTFGPGEEMMAEKIVAASRSGSVKAIVTSLKQFVALSRRAALFIGGDTGPLHIAAACRTPIVGIYGPTEPIRNGPFDPLDISVGLDLECRPNCYRRKCSTIECMDISVSLVEDAVGRRLFQTKLWQLNLSKNRLPDGVSH
ncbi:MAG: lipopolysaccharide heptosyltransferase I [Blastocatellia bacterium]|nr:lipopolysaccharide heptosyltransferase I [Blastocatellia bacterium]